MSLALAPMTLEEANAYVAEHHRHHRPVVGHKFSLAVAQGEVVVGVAIVGRPVARRSDDGWTLEVTRLCTDGTANACSFLYAAAWRATRALGYRRLITFTLPAEGGASLRAGRLAARGEHAGTLVERAVSAPRRQASAPDQTALGGNSMTVEAVVQGMGAHEEEGFVKLRIIHWGLGAATLHVAVQYCR